MSCYSNLARCFGLFTLLFNGVAFAQAPESSFQWESADADPLFQTSNFRHLPLTSECPIDLKNSLTQQSDDQKVLYGQIRFGAEDSRRVTIAIDNSDEASPQLFADMDRNRDLTMNELVEPQQSQQSLPPSWVFKLPVEDSVGDPSADSESPKALETRELEVRLSSQSLLIATRGYLTGKVVVDGKPYAARRSDEDSDGQLNGNKDRLWIDLDDDKTWDPLTEQFANLPVIRLGDDRFKLQTSWHGSTCTLEKLTQVGNIELVLKDRKLGRKIKEISVTLVEASGIFATFDQLKTPQQLPCGKYRVHNVVCKVANGDNEYLTFSFQAREKASWVTLDEDGKLEIDPFGEFQFSATADADALFRLDALNIQPRLVTESGLQIVSCYRNDDINDQVPAFVTIQSVAVDEPSTDQWIDNATSGYA